MEAWLTVYYKIIEMSIQASITVAVVLFVRALFKLIKVPKKYAYIIWIIPFIRLVCPFFLESQFSIMPEEVINYESREDTISDSEVNQDLEPLHNPVLNQVPDLSNNNTTVNPNYGNTQPNMQYPVIDNIVEENSSTVETPSVNEKTSNWGDFKLEEVLASLWLIGIVSIIIYSIVSLVRFKKRLVGSVLISDDVYGCDYIDTAFVIGIVKPRIYVPSHISDGEMEYVVAHERLHIKRFDYIFKPLAYFIVAIHWFNPVVWLAYLLMEKDMEMSCDEAVLGELGFEKKTEYAKALLKLSTGRRFVSSMPTAFAEGETKGRVKNIMKIKKPLIVVGVVAVIAVAVLAVVLLTNPKGGNTTESSKGSDVVKEMPVGRYYMQVDEETSGAGNIYKFVPVLEISEDGSISFSYDPLSSYYNFSFDGYTIEDNTLSFTTEGGRKFTFIIEGENKLSFDAESSYDMSVADERIVHMVTDKAEFVLASEDSDEYEDMSQVDMDLIYYSSIEEISYKQAGITDDMPLGADGVILDYVDDNIVIFHGYAGLFVYDLNNFKMIASVDTSSIDFGSSTYTLNTQGDNAYTFSVSPYGKYVYMLPVSTGEDFSFEIKEGGETNEYAGPFAFSYEVETGKLYACAPALLENLDTFEGRLESSEYITGIEEASGYYSIKCVETSEGVYGYLRCATGLWKDICYVESDMVYMLYGETVDSASTLLEDYPKGEEIYIKIPNLTKVKGLGGDGAILDYVDDNVIIFHGWYGLFVYDRNYQMISDAFDLYSIDCHYTQGDVACLVEVGNDYRIYLTPGNQDNAYIYDMNEDKLIKVSKEDIQDVDKERAILVTDEHIQDDHTSFQSYNCVEINQNGKIYYGYLLSGSGLWYDLGYIEESEYEQKNVELLRDYLDDLEENFNQFVAGSADAASPHHINLYESAGTLYSIINEPYYQVYKYIVDMYATASKENWDSIKYEEEGLCYIFGYNGYNKDKNGYYVYDINGDGIKELIIGENDENSWANHIYDIYTVNVYNDAVLVANGGERSRYSIYDDGIIGLDGASGAGSSGHWYYELSGVELVLVEAVMYESNLDSDNPWFYSTTSEEPEDGESITEEEAHEIIKDLEYEIFIDFVPFE